MTDTVTEPKTVWVAIYDPKTQNYIAVERTRQYVITFNKTHYSCERLDWYFEKDECEEQCKKYNSM